MFIEKEIRNINRDNLNDVQIDDVKLKIETESGADLILWMSTNIWH